jgi:hypothetical protein
MHLRTLSFLMLINAFSVQPIFGMLTLFKRIVVIDKKRVILFRDTPNLTLLNDTLRNACKKKLARATTPYHRTTQLACEKLNKDIEDVFNPKIPSRRLSFNDWCEKVDIRYSIGLGLTASTLAEHFFPNCRCTLAVTFVAFMMVMQQDGRMTRKKAIAHLLSDESPAVISQEHKKFCEYLNRLSNTNNSMEKE